MKKGNFIRILYFFVVIIFSSTCISCIKKPITRSEKNTLPLKATFSQYIKGLHMPVLVDFGSNLCVPCKMMIPVIEELKIKYSSDLTTIFIDINEDPEKVKEFSIKIIPTQIFFDANGVEVNRHNGFISLLDILSAFQTKGILIKAR
jgi:thiol-disulfide isomerase/thioredoxin